MLDFIVDSLEKIEEKHHDLYEQDGEKFKLKVQGIDTGKELKISLVNERNDHLQTKNSLKKTKKDLETLTKKKDNEKPDNVEELLQVEKDETSKAKGKFASSETKLKATLILVELNADKKIGKLLLPQIQKDLVFDEDTEKVSIDTSTGYATIEDYTKNLKTEYKDLLPGSKAEGDESKGSGESARKEIKRDKFDGMDQDTRRAKLKDGYTVID